MSRSIAANALAMLAAKLLPPVFAFTVHVSVARLAGAETLGAYVNLLAVLMIFQAIAGAGLQFLVSRDIAARPDEALTVVRAARALGVVTGLAGTLLYLAYAVWLLPPGAVRPALVLAITILPSAWIALQEAVFIGTRTHHWIAVVAVVENSIKAGLSVALLAAGYGLLAVCAAIALARLAGLASGSLLVRRIGLAGSWRIDPGSVGASLRALAPFSMLFVLSMIYFRIDVPIVHWLTGERETGYYGAASTLMLALLLIPESALAALYPRLARTFTASPDGYAGATWVIAKTLTVALAALAISVICCADLVVRLVYGGAFAPAAPVLRLLALALPCHALNGALGQALQAGGRQREMARIVIGGVVAHIALNVLLVGAIGITGAALAMLISSFGTAMATLYALHTRVVPLGVSWRSAASAVALAGPLALVAWTPDAARPAVALLALAWLVGGSIHHGTIGLADVARLRSAFKPEGAAV